MRAPAPAVPRSVALPAQPARAAAPPPTLTNDEAGLRALILLQGADGIFGGDLAVTLAAVAALVARGHSHREGLFKAELKRTLASLRKLVGTTTGDDAGRAALAIALLTRPFGEALPDGLPSSVAAILSGFDAQEAEVAGPIVRSVLAAAPLYRGSAASEQIVSAFALV